MMNGALRRTTGRVLAAVLLALPVALPPGAAGQPPEGDKLGGDVTRMVREGMVAALESRFAGQPTREHLRLLALAAANRAARAGGDTKRQAAFEDAQRRFLAWINAAQFERGVDPTARTVRKAAAQVAYAGMILSQWIVADLDKFELTGGRRGDRRRLRGLLRKARETLEEVRAEIGPLVDRLAAGDPQTEDQFLALGIYDALPRVDLDSRFNLAWTNLYLARLESRSTAQRTETLRAAERDFRELVGREPPGDAGARCLLGLAMTLGEQGRYDEARRHFAEALSRADDGVLLAQIRVQQARYELRAERFDQARSTLGPLVVKDPARLKPAERPALFYINLAHLWDANSYLLEAAALRRQARTSPAASALLVRARRARETGLRKMNALSQRGGAWPTLVGLYIADTIDLQADEKTLSPTELLFAARQYSQQKKYRHALALLEEAARRKQADPQLAGEILYDLGVCHYRCRERDRAAEVFAQMAETYKAHPKAIEAITYAYELRARIARDSGKPEDYRKLAGVLESLLRDFPEHPKRDDATWWLPTAWERAGEYEAAARAYGRIPPGSPRHAEARFRMLLCRRQALDQQRGALSAARLRAGARDVSAALRAYARQALRDLAASPDDRALRRRAALALVNAAEIQAWPEVGQYDRALELLADFKRRFPDSTLLGRVLAVRINAYRGLGRFDQAARVVAEFLQTVSPEQAGGTLGVVARGMQEEVDRLESSGDEAAARKLAAASIPTFEQLLAWVDADRRRAKYRDAVRFGLARMQLLAGHVAAAAEIADELAAKDPRNGNYRRLRAGVLTAQAEAEPTEARVAAARDAWGAMLRDPALRSSAPERYWEARYHYLAMLLREGRAAEVEKAIRQERIWYPALGGPRWKARLDRLYEDAAGMLEGRRSPASRPASAPSAAPEVRQHP